MSAGDRLQLIFYGKHPDGTAVLVQVWGEDDAGPDCEVGRMAELAHRPVGASTRGPPLELQRTR